jgi:hypothetical protein
MLDDTYRDLCDQIAISRGDSDLVPAVNMVKLRNSRKRKSLSTFHRRTQNGASRLNFAPQAHAHRTLPPILLSKSQFPDTIPDGAGGTLTRPAPWK